MTLISAPSPRRSKGGARDIYLSTAVGFLALDYEPIATLPGLNLARHRAGPDRASRHWQSLDRQPRHRCGPAGGLTEWREYLLVSAIPKAGLWHRSRHWRRPDVSVHLPAAELCVHSVAPRAVAHALQVAQMPPRHVTIEIGDTGDCALSDIGPALQRLKALGVRLSYDKALGTESDLDRFPFDEVRIAFGTSEAAASSVAVTEAVQAARERHQSVLATGVATGGHVMTALTAGASFIDGAFAGVPRSDNPRSRLRTRTLHVPLERG